jgi:hypothetical protein
MRPRHITLVLLPALVAVFALTMLARPGKAAAQPGAGCTPPASALAVSICVDRLGGTYLEGDTVTYCIFVNFLAFGLDNAPLPLSIRVISEVNGTPRAELLNEVFLTDFFCSSATIAAPFGNEVFVAQLIDAFGVVRSEDRAGFRSAPRQAAPAPAPAPRPATAPAPAQPQHDLRDFTLVNASPFVITELYVVASESPGGWGSNLLAGRVLFPGQSAPVQFNRFVPGVCFYDLLIVDQIGEEAVLWAVDLCSTTVVDFF